MANIFNNNNLNNEKVADLFLSTDICTFDQVSGYIDSITEIHPPMINVSPMLITNEGQQLTELSNTIYGTTKTAITAGRNSRVGTNHLLVLSVSQPPEAYVIVSGDFVDKFTNICRDWTNLNSNLNIKPNSFVESEYSKPTASNYYFAYTDSNSNSFCKAPIIAVECVTGLQVQESENNSDLKPLIGTKLTFADPAQLSALSGEFCVGNNNQFRCKQYFGNGILSSYLVSADNSSTLHILGHPDIGSDDVVLPIGSGTPDAATGKSYQTNLGMLNTTQERASTAIGSMNTAQGRFSVALGNKNVAAGFNSTAIGGNNFAIGNTSTAIGNNAYANHNNAIVINAAGSNKSSISADSVNICARTDNNIARIYINGEELISYIRKRLNL